MLSEYFWSGIGQILMAAICGGAVMIWGWLEGTVGKWYAVVGGILVTAAIYLVINQSGWWEPATKIKIRQWLDESTISVRSIPDTSMVFKFELTDPFKRVVYLMQPIDRKVVTIESYVAPESSPFAKQQSLNEQSIIPAIRRTKLSLAQLGVNFNGLEFPLKQVKIFEGLPESALTQLLLMEKIMLVIRGTAIAQEELNEAVKK